MTRISRLLLPGFVALLAGCSNYVDSTTAYPDFGDAIRQNSAVMIVDPNPPTAANTDIDMNGERAALAYDRYRTGTVIEPLQLRTSDVLTSGN